ncbi:MAG: A/G-specific adenine glycosylase [Candidatus Roizmanbacteria bacterium]
MVTKKQFQSIIYFYYKKNKRDFPWRDIKNPYYVMVSEIMLQQTQVQRGMQKYEEFIATFPTLESLAKANLSDVLKVWQGLGYNRRGKYLKETAEILVKRYGGVIPSDQTELEKLPGIGHGTAGAIVAYGFDKPSIFVETNIRAVFLYFFFKDQEVVSDTMLMPYVIEMMDEKSPRQWYYALTDYGVMLKKKEKFTNIQSKSYQRQAPLKGSNREVRGAILKSLTQKKTVKKSDLYDILIFDKERIAKALDSLKGDGMMVEEEECYKIA